MSEQEKKICFAKVMAGLAEYYARELSEGVLMLYWRGLKKYSIAELEAAIDRHMENPDTGQFMPKVSDINRAVSGTTQSSAAIAWAKTMRAVGSVGQYQSIVFDDALIHLTIDDLGGWPGICKTAERELPFLQKRFETLYRAYKLRGDDVPRHRGHLCGLSEMSNGAMGYRADPPLLVGDLEKARAVMFGGSDVPRLLVHHHVTPESRLEPMVKRLVACA